MIVIAARAERISRGKCDLKSGAPGERSSYWPETKNEVSPALGALMESCLPLCCSHDEHTLHWSVPLLAVRVSAVGGWAVKSRTRTSCAASEAGRSKSRATVARHFMAFSLTAYIA